MFSIAALALTAPAVASSSLIYLNAAALTDPVGLFTTVCRGDQVKLPRKQFEATSFSALPRAARDAFSFAVPPDGFPQTRPAVLSDADVPNQIFAVLPGKQVFLILPASSVEGRAAPVCGVVWNGSHYDDALKAVRPALKHLADQPRLQSGIPGVNFTVVQSQGAIIGAAEFNNRTVLRIAPDLSPLQEPKAQ